MKTKATLILSIVLLLFPLMTKAQNDSSYMKGFDQYKEDLYRNYNSFLDQAYSDFEAFLAQAWTEYQAIAGQTKAYSGRKPSTVPALTTESGIIDINAPAFDDSLPMLEEHQENRNAEFNYGIDPAGSVNFSFYGNSITFDVPNSLRIEARGIKEKSIANYYAAMCKNDPDHVVQHQLDQAVNKMGLNEWGYFILLRDLSKTLFNDIDQRVLFTFYMLHSHGFKVRLGRGSKSDRLLLLLAIDNSKEVYSETFFRINGYKYYIVYGNGLKKESIYSYDEKADQSGLKEIRLDFNKALSIAACDKKRRLHLAKADLDIEIPYSTAHLRYYDEIPTTVFPVYFKTPIAREAETVLAEAFASLGKRYNKVQMVDIMLNFVQTAFAYKIDEQQFGREKYFFPEEVIGLPYSDCEDRSALFAWLVSRFVGYDVVGVLYNDHLATAVCFGIDAQIRGESVDFGGKRYVVCDPTYSNAPIGTIMPKYANTSYEIVKIN